MNAEDEIARSLHEVPELVAHAIAPVPPSRAENASHAKELLKHRATIHAQERLVFSLRADLAARSQATARSEDQRRALAGELADLRARLDEVEKEAARAEQRATRARDVAARADSDKDVSVRRGQDALRRFEQRHARELEGLKREFVTAIVERDGALAESSPS